VAATRLDELLASCQRAAVHLEMRDGYMLDDPMLVKWRAGFRYDPSDRESWWNGFLASVEQATSRGVDIRRARIVSEPVSEYIRFEYDVTFRNVAAGEQVRWLPRRKATGIPLPGNDFWLFDDQILLVNHFNGDGDWTGSEEVTDAGIIRLCGSAFLAVWERATPHEDYRP